MTLPTPQELAAVQKLAGQITAEAYHPKLVEAAEAGHFTIVDLLDSLPWFKGASDWTAWRSFLCALYGLPMTPQELGIYRRCTGRENPPTKQARRAWVVVGRRGRKALALDTPVPTPNGWTTIGDIQPGDTVFDENGRQTTVVATTNVMFGRPCYELEFSDGDKIVADAGHLWRVFSRPAKRADRSIPPTPKLLDTEEISRSPRLKWAKESKWALQFAGPLECEGQAGLPIDPYVLGVWLGDGTSRDGRITTADEEIVNELRERGYDPVKGSSRYSYDTHGLYTHLKRLDLLRNKHIPSVYMRASTEQRLLLLQGLMDTDGHCSLRGHAIFSNKNQRLANQVLELARTLSFKATMTQRMSKLYGKECGPSYSVSLRTYGAPYKPFRLQRKLVRCQDGNPNLRWRFIRECRAVPSVPVKCIQVANTSGMFLVGRSMIPTHNSAIAALIGVWHAAFKDYRKPGSGVAPGTRATILILSDTKKNARQIHGYAKAILESPGLKHLLQSDPTTETISLTTGVDMEIRAATKTSGRSPTTPAALLDEIAFWKSDDSANPDKEIVEGIRPGMITIPNSLLLALSSPYARRGILWENYKNHFGKEGDPVLVWQADTLSMHDAPLVREEVTAAYEEDAVAAKAEFGAQFRADVVSFIPEEVVDAAIRKGRFQIKPVPGVTYRAFCDPSGGTVDSFTLAISHVEYPERTPPETGLVPKPKVVVDLLKEWQAPFDPLSVVKEMVPILYEYGCKFVKGDHYAGEWPTSAFAQYKIGYQVAEDSKSDYYLKWLPLMTAGSVELLDNARMRAQMIALDRKVSSSGHESVDNRNGHEDLANCVAGSVVESSVGLRLPPPKPVVTYQKPDGTIDWERLNRDQLKKRMEEARWGPDTDEGIPERYSYR